MANKTKKDVKKKKVANKEEKKNNKKNQKVEQAKKAREAQFTKLEQEKSQNATSSQEEISRLAEALILAEIVGLPRCKERRSRRNSRRYIG